MTSLRISRLIGPWLWAFVAWFLFAGCGKKEPAAGAKPSKAPVVSVQLAEKAAISRSIQLTGSVEPVRLARIASPAESPVAGLLVREGDCVRQDQLLLTIGRSSARGDGDHRAVGGDRRARQ